MKELCEYQNARCNDKTCVIHIYQNSSVISVLRLSDMFTGVIPAGMHCLSIAILLQMILYLICIYYLYSCKIVSIAVER